MFKIVTLLLANFVPNSFIGQVIQDLCSNEPQTGIMILCEIITLLLEIAFFVLTIWTFDSTISFIFEENNFIKIKILNIIFFEGFYFCLYIAGGNLFVCEATKYIYLFIFLLTSYFPIRDMFRKFNSCNPNSSVVVDFKTIKNLYQVSPQRFILPSYYKDNLSWERCTYRTDKLAYNLKIIKKLDFVMFYFWCYKLSRDDALYKASESCSNNVAINKQNLKIIIAQAQKDIDSLKAQANNEIEQANDMMGKVKNNLQNKRTVNNILNIH